MGDYDTNCTSYYLTASRDGGRRIRARARRLGGILSSVSAPRASSIAETQPRRM